MKITASNVTINTADMDRSIDFYKSIGFSLVHRWQNYYAHLSAPGIMIGLHPSDGDIPSNLLQGFSIGFTTDDFDGAKDMLEDLSINYSYRKEEGGDFLHFTDPNGLPLYFIKPK